MFICGSKCFHTFLKPNDTFAYWFKHFTFFFFSKFKKIREKKGKTTLTFSEVRFGLMS